MMAEPARQRMRQRWLEAKPEHRDEALDLYLDCRDRATEWDAGEWAAVCDMRSFVKHTEAFDEVWRNNGDTLCFPTDVVPAIGERSRRP